VDADVKHTQEPLSNFTYVTELTGDSVHVWTASLEQLQFDIDSLRSLLSPDELARADRFYFERDRNAYIAGRGLLRTLLSAYLGTPPAQIEFRYAVRGKPSLKAESPEQTIQFNLSHAQDLIVYAFSRNRHLGIDVEQIARLANYERIAEQYFSPLEISYIRGLPEDEKTRAFFTLWTCKEACLKATGDGLAVPLDQVEITLKEGKPPGLITLPGKQDLAAVWQLETFEIATGYLASLAIEGGGCQVSFHQINSI